MPLILVADKEKFHLIDGYKRFYSALGNKETTVDAQILPESISAFDLGLVLLQTHFKEIMSSAVNKINFLEFLISIGVTRKNLLAHFLTPLEFQPHPIILSKCLKITKLPKENLDMLHRRDGLQSCGFHCRVKGTKNRDNEYEEHGIHNTLKRQVCPPK